jgi:Ring finger domain
MVSTMNSTYMTDPNIFFSTAPPMANMNQPQGRPAMEILAAVFFVVAGTWLILALLYSCLVLWFLRLRSRGEIDRIYEEDFGRIHVCGGVHVPLGCMFRRYIQHLQNENNPRPHQYMTLSERRKAMNRLMQQHVKQETVCTRVDAGEDDSEENVCSICLANYESLDAVFCSKACQHQFHWDCLLDWLQRPGTIECPCCRLSLVSEEDVYKTVLKVRKERKRDVRTKSSESGTVSSHSSGDGPTKDVQLGHLTVTSGDS